MKKPTLMRPKQMACGLNEKGRVERGEGRKEKNISRSGFTVKSTDPFPCLSNTGI